MTLTGVESVRPSSDGSRLRDRAGVRLRTAEGRIGRQRRRGELRRRRTPDTATNRPSRASAPSNTPNVLACLTLIPLSSIRAPHGPVPANAPFERSPQEELRRRSHRDAGASYSPSTRRVSEVVKWAGSLCEAAQPVARQPRDRSCSRTNVVALEPLPRSRRGQVWELARAEPSAAATRYPCGSAILR